MKIDIYVQSDLSALIVPSGCDLTKLPEDVRAMTSCPSEWQVKKERNTSDHIIGLDVEAALNGIKKKGYYINRAIIKMSEVQ